LNLAKRHNMDIHKISLLSVYLVYHYIVLYMIFSYPTISYRQVYTCMFANNGFYPVVLAC